MLFKLACNLLINTYRKIFGGDILLIQHIINGLATGSLYALAAFGLVLIYKTSDIINFAQGEIAMFSTFVAFTLITKYGLSYWMAFIITIIFAALLGIAIERFFLRPIQGAPVLSLIIVTLGLYMIINGIAGWIFGYDTHNFPTALNGENISFMGAVINQHNLFLVVITVLIMIILFMFLKYTLAGIAIRATSLNPNTARLMGIGVNKIYSISWMVSAILGAISGILIAPFVFLDVNMMGEVNLKAFTAAVLGGFDTFLGPVVGALLLGVLENLVAGYISTEMKSTFAFIFIVLILFIKPNGILGRTIRKKV